MPVDPTTGTSGAHEIGLRSLVSGRPVVSTAAKSESGVPASDRVQVAGGMANELRLVNSSTQNVQSQLQRIHVGILGLDLIQAKIESFATPGSAKITESAMTGLRDEVSDIIDQSRFGGKPVYDQEDVNELLRAQPEESPSNAYLRSLQTVDRMRTSLEGALEEARRGLASNEVTRANLLSAMNLRVAGGRDEAATLVDQVRRSLIDQGGTMDLNLQPSAVMRLV